MAKSTRSKWKKLHRRQRAEAERDRTAERIRKLHDKLELTVRGGISGVPPQEPERRFHFRHPELDPAHDGVARQQARYDFTRPLVLPPPRTCYYGKSDPTGPHPQAVHYEVVDADAPLAGHALTKADMARLLRSKEKTPRAPSEDATHAREGPSGEKKNETPLDANEEEENEHHHHRNRNPGQGDSASDGPEEYVFELEKPTWQKASSSGKGKSTQRKDEKEPPARLGKAHKKGQDLVAVEDTQGGEKEEEEEGGGKGRKAARIKSMETPQKKKGTVVAAEGSRKMKKVLTSGSSKGMETRRVVSSGSKASKKLEKPLRKGGKVVVL